MAATKKALSKHSKAGKLHYREEDIRWATYELAVWFLIVLDKFFFDK